MTMEWLLVPVFLLCALIMKYFIKAVDSFILHTIIPEETIDASKQCSEESAQINAPEPGRNGRWRKLSLNQIADRLHRERRARQGGDVSVIEIGTARPTQIRIRRYEQS